MVAIETMCVLSTMSSELLDMKSAIMYSYLILLTFAGKPVMWSP